MESLDDNAEERVVQLRRRSGRPAGRRPRAIALKGISTIVATLLLLMIVLASASALVTFGLGFLSQSRESIQTATQLSRNKNIERFVVDDVWFNGTNNVGISVFNVGSNNITIETIIVNNTLFELSSPVGLDILERATINVTYPESITAGSTYQVKVVSSRGAFYASYWKA